MSHEHVVVIYPHPDDESFGASGTISKYREQDIPVTYLCGTLGEMGRNMGSPTFANRETLSTFRKEELKKACKALDIDYRLLGYRDKTLEFEQREQVAAHLKEILQEIRPTLVITHYPGYAVHPDHDALGAAAIQAVADMEEDVRPELWAQAIATNFEKTLGKPDIIHDVKPYWDKKMAAIETHLSQASGMMSLIKNKPDFNENEELEHLRYERFYRWKLEE
ncbi:bacillithiol biosynthesis deacetylase BshB2 [Thalassobacillus pellis]|uniref:bacillithiol biosynthesis deacetylase BshB2 n=1 Tax=Thalassobacillus pellis TaxID=748008 RepID=UPI00195F7EFB|nr:bacillithiol biosynthesis deacetylase BshB2 [Thalassobacillus pellis]MBM7551392.1 bacillithiol biosynthesis deacetylase BshB2 [Thalassobacillus pellis]